MSHAFSVAAAFLVNHSSMVVELTFPSSRVFSKSLPIGIGQTKGFSFGQPLHSGKHCYRVIGSTPPFLLQA